MSPSKRFLGVCLIWAGLSGAPGCHEHGRDHTGSAQIPADGGAADLGADASGPSTLCTDPRADPWLLPLTKSTSAGGFRVSLLEGSPAPPAIGKNTWTLRVTNASGQPASGLSPAVHPFMPDHGHGTALPEVVVGTEAGTYQIRAMDLFMAGVWQVEVSLGTAQPDRVVLTYCLAEL